MNTSKIKAAVLYHIFYEDTVYDIPGELATLAKYEVSYYFNICSDTPNKEDIAYFLANSFPGCTILFTSNVGKDIGGKLSLLKYCIAVGEDAEWLLFMHDKKSLQAVKGKSWKKELLAILNANVLSQILLFNSKSKQIGLVAAKNYVISETASKGMLLGKNSVHLNNLIEAYGIETLKWEYVAGTIFWGKASVFFDFFTKHDPLIIRGQLESGNVLDNFGPTRTHAWERIFSWIILNAGYRAMRI